jgi:aspartate carbamoyltransferase catalytic subunit
MEKRDFSGADLISIVELSRGEIGQILDRALEMEKMERREKMTLAREVIMAGLFFEPSTRTRLSFEAAMHGLGGRIIGFTSEEGSSVSKGETLWDTICTVDQYSDIIVIRHPQDGAARLASEAAQAPVINAGDGSNQHPTQTLLDLYSIRKILGKLDDFSIGIVGDLKYGRTVHSLATALAKYKDVRMYFVSPPILRIPRNLQIELQDSNVKYTEHALIEDVVDRVDILYMTRIQQERFPEPAEYEAVKELYRLDVPMLANARAHLKVLHPLPRITEISRQVDSTDFSCYFTQTHNGVVVRQAILSMLLGV